MTRTRDRGIDHGVYRHAVIAALLAALLAPHAAFASDDDAEPDAPDVAPPPPDEAHVAVGAGGHVSFGMAPAVAVGVTVSAEVATGRWSLGLEGRYDLPARGRTTEGGVARTTLAGASFVPCLRAKGTWACAVVMTSRASASGNDTEGASAHDAWFVIGVGARLMLHFSLPLGFALRVGGEVLGHPISHELAVNGHRIFKTSAVSTTFGPTLVRAF